MKKLFLLYVIFSALQANAAISLVCESSTSGLSIEMNVVPSTGSSIWIYKPNQQPYSARISSNIPTVNSNIYSFEGEDLEILQDGVTATLRNSYTRELEDRLVCRNQGRTN
jgi:hypothetical protein